MLDSVDRFRKFLVKAMCVCVSGRIQFWSVCVLPKDAAALCPSKLQRSGSLRSETGSRVHRQNKASSYFSLYCTNKNSSRLYLNTTWRQTWRKLSKTNTKLNNNQQIIVSKMFFAMVVQPSDEVALSFVLTTPDWRMKIRLSLIWCRKVTH